MKRSYEICLEISGPTAMWTRGDTGDSPVSYPVPTYSAVKGIFESILFNQLVEIIPVKVEVCSPIVFYPYHTNYYGPLRKSNSLKNGVGYQLLATVLMNPCYRLYAILKNNRCSFDNLSKLTMKWNQHTTNPSHAFQDMFNRRIKRGQCFSIPFLGWKEFTPDYMGAFRPKTQVQESINLQIPSMLRQVFPHGVSSKLDYLYDLNVKVINGVLIYPDRSTND